MSSPNQYIKHITEIKAPIDAVWEVLFDIDDWKWNKWTRLEAEEASEGTQGKLKASYEGNDEWSTYDFTFGEVSADNHVLQWCGNIGPSGCLFSAYHTMKLEVIDKDQTRLIHSEKFGGILPALNLGLPFETLDRNYLLMNESLKEYIENK
jgi:hypothetical protein